MILFDNIHIDGQITIAVEQFDNYAISRKQLRQEQSIAARKLLSSALCKLYGEDKIALWSLAKSQNGKPIFQGIGAPSVSIAHSGDWVACAIAHSATVGVDIEVVKSRDWNAYSQHVFHPAEAPWVFDAVGIERNIRGLTCWCRKEAVVKALGVGMVVSPSEIGFSPDGTLIAFPERLGNLTGWSTYSAVVRGESVVAMAWR